MDGALEILPCFGIILGFSIGLGDGSRRIGDFGLLFIAWTGFACSTTITGEGERGGVLAKPEKRFKDTQQCTYKYGERGMDYDG